MLTQWSFQESYANETWSNISNNTITKQCAIWEGILLIRFSLSPGQIEWPDLGENIVELSCVQSNEQKSYVKFEWPTLNSHARWNGDKILRVDKSRSTNTRWYSLIWLARNTKLWTIWYFRCFHIVLWNTVVNGCNIVPYSKTIYSMKERQIKSKELLPNMSLNTGLFRIKRPNSPQHMPQLLQLTKSLFFI